MNNFIKKLKKNAKPTVNDEDYAIIANSRFFDPKFYLENNIDVAESGIDPVEHFRVFGWKEGRKPSKYFCLKSFCKLENFPYLRLNPLLAFEKGILEGFDFPSEIECVRLDMLEKCDFFDEGYYISANKDVKESGINAKLHFVRLGWLEGRAPFKGVSTTVVGDNGNGPDFKIYLENLNNLINVGKVDSKSKLDNLVIGEEAECVPSVIKDIDILIIVKNYHLASALWRASFFNEQLRNNSVKSIVVSERDAKDYIEKCNIILFQKFPSFDSNMQEIFEIAKVMGVECWFDLDDAFIPDTIKQCGQYISGLWGDDQAKRMADSFISAMKPCKRIIVSTPRLKELLQQVLGNKHIYVRRNRIPLRYLARYEKIPKATEPLRLIYASGSMSHKNDFELIAPSIEKYLKKFKDSTLTLIGGENVEVPDDIKKRENVVILPRMNFSDMITEIGKHDIMLVPLAKNDFNDAKSNIKFIEAASAITPVLTTSAAEFSEYIEDGVNGFVEDDFENWFERLVALRKQGSLLVKCGKNAFDLCSAELNTQIIEKDILKVIKSLTEKSVELRYPSINHRKYPSWSLAGNRYVPSQGHSQILVKVEEYISEKRKRGQAKYVVYTCLSNNYDSLKIPEHLDADVDYICFSDQPVYGYGVWEIRSYDKVSSDATRTSRHPKILPQHYLSEYEASIYIDANFIPTVSMIDYIKRFERADVKIANVKHPWRDCIYEEAEACRSSGKDATEVIDATINFLKKNGFPEKYGLFENNLIYRKHNDYRVSYAMTIWWDVYNRYSRRDQLSYMFAINKSGLSPALFFYSDKKHVRNSAEFAYFSHGDDDVWSSPL